MKILLVGEGPHDLGDESLPGVVQTLVERVLSRQDLEWISVRWKDLPRFSRKRGKLPGDADKAASAILRARREGCDAAVLVRDNDRNAARLSEMRDGVERASAPGSPPGVCGVAAESIEAWALGGRSGLRVVTGLDEATLDRVYRLARVERYAQSSGKPELRPKNLLDRVAVMSGESTAHREFRLRVAEETDPVELADACPEGFAPFRDALLTAFEASDS